MLLLHHSSTLISREFIPSKLLKEGPTLLVRIPFPTRCFSSPSSSSGHLKEALTKVICQITEWTNNGIIPTHKIVTSMKDKRALILRLTCMIRAGNFKLDMILSGTNTTDTIWCIWVLLIWGHRCIIRTIMITMIDKENSFMRTKCETSIWDLLILDTSSSKERINSVIRSSRTRINIMMKWISNTQVIICKAMCNRHIRTPGWMINRPKIKWAKKNKRWNSISKSMLKS